MDTLVLFQGNYGEKGQPHPALLTGQRVEVAMTYDSVHRMHYLFGGKTWDWVTGWDFMDLGSSVHVQ